MARGPKAESRRGSGRPRTVARGVGSVTGSLAYAVTGPARWLLRRVRRAPSSPPRPGAGGPPPAGVR